MMLNLIIYDKVLIVCISALILLLWFYYKNKDKELLYFISADVFYILGELSFRIISKSMDLPIDFIFFFLFYFFILLYLKQRTTDLLKNPTLKENIKFKTFGLITVDFFTIAILSCLIFYSFDRTSLTSPVNLILINYRNIIYLLYPVLDISLLGYYIYISKVYITSDDIIYLPLTISAFIWTTGDFLFAFEEITQVGVLRLGNSLQLIGFIMLSVLVFLINRHKTDFDYTTIALYQENSKFNKFPAFINIFIISYLIIYFYCFHKYSNSLTLMNPVKELGIILLILLVFRQNIINYSIQHKFINMSKEAKTDPLTGLFSRKYAFSIIESVFKSCHYFNINISALMLDIDHFKKFNDTWGHSCGDYVLIHISEIIRNSIESSNIICRYGGEEILIILPGIDRCKGHLIAENIRKNIESFDFHNGKIKASVKVTVSIGGATAEKSTKNEFDLIEQADTALYKAKEKRNNTFWFSSKIVKTGT